MAGLLTEPRWLGQETGHSERFPEELRRYKKKYHLIDPPACDILAAFLSFRAPGPTSQGNVMEIEAKFRIPNRQVYRELARWPSLAGYTVNPTGTVKVADRYFDTADGRVLAAGYACRLRAQQNTVIATLKGVGGADGAVHRRDEQEVQLTTWMPDPAGWPESPARRLALELTAGAALQSLFELTQSRSQANLLDGTRVVAQLSLDAVRVVVGRRPALYYELEVELAETGAEADLDALVDELKNAWGLVPEGRSKFERALETLRNRGAAVEDRLTGQERAALNAYAASEDADVARRATVVLGWADGLPTREIRERAGLSDGRVRHWLRAFRAERLAIFGDVALPARTGMEAERSTPGPARPQEDLAAGEQAPIAPQEAAPPVLPPDRFDTPAGQVREKGHLPSVAAFCRQNGVDMTHARHVAAQARILFDALKPIHRLPRKRRRLLKLAALLNTVGVTADPERPHRAGRDLILAQPLRSVSTTDRLALACIVAFNRKKVRPEHEATMSALEGRLRTEVLALTALVRVAEALDFSRTQGAEIRAVEGVDAENCEIQVGGPAAEVDALQATNQADLWYKLFNQELTFIPIASQPAQVAEASATAPDEAGAAPETTGAAGRPEIPPILPDEPMSEAGRKVLYLHFSHMIANEPGTRLGQDIEALHDMRVATRRMRAAFQVFTPYFDAKALAPYLKRLRRTGRTLGAVRDLDVLMDKARGYQAGLPPEQAASLEPLLTHWQARRGIARRQMLKYLDSRAYREFTADFAAFLTTPGVGALEIPAGEPVPHQVRHVVPGLIFTRFETVRAYEALLAGAPITTLHRLRIDSKRLRYALEFFRDVLGPETPDLIKQVTGMQDLLGALQDAHVAEGLVAEFLAQQAGSKRKRKKGQPSLEGVEGYRSAQQTAQQELLTRFPEPWAELIGYDFRRNLSLAVAAL